MRKYGDEVLLTPGPIGVPDRILEASARALLHYSGPRFLEKVKEVREGMQDVFGTKKDVLILVGSGRVGLEGAVASLFSPGDEVLAISNGYFGIMFASIFEGYGLGVTRVATDWIKDYDADEIVRTLKANPKIKAISVVFCETSTGVINDLERLGKIAREHGKLLLVDAISAAGAMDFRFDEWGVDVAVTGSQKGLMTPPGLSFAVLSDDAWKAAETSTLPKWYFDLGSARRAIGTDFPAMPGTPAVSLVVAVAEALSMLREEGLPNVYSRTEKMSAAVREGLGALGLRVFPDGVKRRSPTVAVFEAPLGHDAQAIIQTLMSEFGLVAVSGLGSYAKKLLRLGTMGSFYQREALNMIAAVDASLVKLGVNQEAGAGVKACVKALFS